MLSLEDTICAVASAPGGAARGIVRISGPNVPAVLGGCFRGSLPTQLADVRVASVLKGTLVVSPPIGELPGELFYWPLARSYTGQPAAEFHTFGALPLLSAAARTLCQHGARPAEPGEFTLRAFLAGRLDLTQAEAVLGVIDADNANRLTVALGQLAGGMSRPLGRLREDLLQLLAHLEAGLDFVEEDLDFIAPEELETSLSAAGEQVEALLAQLGERAAANERHKVVLTGAPNVGKSSLFNAMIGDHAAIISPQPGTTRDYLSARLSLHGVECELYDTAGLSAVPQSEIDGIAQQSSAELMKSADILIACNDRPSTQQTPTQSGRSTVLQVLTKCDQRLPEPNSGDWIPTSSVTGHGLDTLLNKLREELANLSVESPVAGTAERCYDSLRLAHSSLLNARELNRSRAGEELIAAELRVTLAELGKVVGAVYTDDILDRIFSRFCIGK
jgi:tRNA modification GTPase